MKRIDRKRLEALHKLKDVHDALMLKRTTIRVSGPPLCDRWSMREWLSVLMDDNADNWFRDVTNAAALRSENPAKTPG